MSYTVGAITIERINELDSWPLAAAEMFPAITPDLYPGEVLDLTIATYLVRTPGLTMLVDAGNGNHKHRPVLTDHDGFNTDYLARLSAVVDPGDVDVVVCTHLHPDHCGGLTRLVDDEWVPNFPNARHLVSGVELAWMQALRRSGVSEGPEADIARTYDDSVRPVLEAGLIEIVDVPADLGHGVTISQAAGHTSGHVVVELHQGDEFAIVSGDVVHHPLQFADLSLAQSGDADPAQAHRSRREVVEKLAVTGGLLLPSHFHPGRIARAGAGYSWLPL